MAIGALKRSKKKIKRAYRDSTKAFASSMKVRTVAPVFRTERGYAAYVCWSGKVKGIRRNQCANTGYGSTPKQALVKAHREFAKLLSKRR